MIRCQKCGYTNQSTAKKCIKCNNVLVSESGPKSKVSDDDTNLDIKFKKAPWDGKTDDTGKTMRRVVPKTKPCFLVQLSEDNEEEGTMIPVKGEVVNLNRDFLDQGNTSLSRNSHATLTLKDGEWWIMNASDVKTTFLQINKPIKVADGDVILLGDTMFKFKEKP
jgi:hypothetical protein